MLPLLLYKIKGYRAEELQYPTEYPHPGLCVSPHHKCSMCTIFTQVPWVSMNTALPLPAFYLLPLHHVEKVSKRWLLRTVECQQGQRALHFCEALSALLTLLRQLRLGELQSCFCLTLTDELNQVLLLVSIKDRQAELAHTLVGDTQYSQQ